jgi:hypothetical protein
MLEREPLADQEESPEKRPVPKILFDMGQVVVTSGASYTLHQLERHPVQLLARHATGDWGQLPEQDIEENERSLKHGFRLFSAYNIEDSRFYVITEWDRSVTTVLLPEEY